MAIQPVSAVGREDAGEEQQQSSLLSQSLKKQEESRTSLTEMIRDTKEKADAQREKFKLAKTSARRRIVQLEAARRSDPDHADQIKAAVGQLRKAVSRAGRKKLELTREQLSRARQKRMDRENKRREAQRIKQELRRSQAMRAVRESGYFRETDIANRHADQLTATKMELRHQAEQLGAITSVDAALQGYSAGAQLAAADVDAPIEAPQVNVQA